MPQSHQRLAVDLDQIESQLNQAHPPKSDPMAELARIVGQDDPFRAMLARDGAGSAPRLTDQSPAAAGRLLRPAAGAGEPGLPTGYGSQVPTQFTGHDGESASPAEAYDTYPDDFAIQAGARAVEQRRSRKGLITVGVILGAAALGVGGAVLKLSGPKLMTSGEPPIIRADREPLKVPPENPGGVDIPNQDAQVYDRAAKDSQTRIVNREEQPVDVQQAARSMQANASRPPIPGPAVTAAVTPGGPMANTAPSLPPGTSAAAGLGEPRRVKTVSVRPDGTMFGADQAAAAAPRGAAPPAAASPMPQASVPAAAAPAASMPTTTPSAMPQSTPVPPQRPRLEARPTVPAPAPTAPDPTAAAQASNTSRPAQRTAAAQPVAAADAPETTSAAGGYTVQLSVMNSEQEARAQYEQLRRKFSGELSGMPPLIRAAEVNGKTIYRLRVGPMSQADAGTLCTKLKSSGGNCFIARN